MIVNIILLVLISLFSFIFCINKPINRNILLENPEIIADNIINSNKRNNSFLSFATSGCILSFEDGIKKYIFYEKGWEISFQLKYKNEGNSDNCNCNRNLLLKSPIPYVLKDTKVEGGNNLKYNITSDILKINFNLKNGKSVIISYKIFYKDILSMFFDKYTVYIEKGIKYIFRARQPLEIFGNEYGKLKEAKQKNGAKYYYYNDTNYGFKEKIYLSAYGIKFKSDLIVKLDFNYGRILKYISVPNLHQFGNNVIISSNIKSNLNENLYSFENDKRFITVKSNERKDKFIFKFSKEVESRIDNEWKVEGADLVYNCTKNIRKKVKEILCNKNSKEKDYIILGKWVYNNIKYNSSYLGAKWTVDEILEKKVGVCDHITKLYNAFLNCINIDAMYANGFAHTQNDYNINLTRTHAWTMAKIDEKWIPLDATWNFFDGKLPVSHIFKYYGVGYRRTSADWGTFGNVLDDIISKIKIFQSNSKPECGLNITALSFLSRELKDDDEGDFELVFNYNDNYNVRFSLFKKISLLMVILLIIIIMIFNCLKKRNKKKNPELGVELNEEI